MSPTPPRPLAALHYFATDRSLPVGDFARAAADRGFDAILLPEHTHIPVCSGSPYPGGGDLPERYRRTLDPYVALSVVAAQTDLEIGTCISLVAQHDPIALAKTAATLDFVSGGRFSPSTVSTWRWCGRWGRTPRPSSMVTTRTSPPAGRGRSRCGSHRSRCSSAAG